MKYNGGPFLLKANNNISRVASLDGSDCQSCFMMVTSDVGRGFSVWDGGLTRTGGGFRAPLISGRL